MKLQRTDISVVGQKLNNIDILFALNVLLFIWMCQFAYYQRFVEYRGAGNIAEFFVYASLIIIAMAAGWWYFRRFEFPSYLVILFQIGIIIHFMGGLVPVENGRLYDAYILEIRFDKYVHFLNAFIAAAIIRYMFGIFKVRIPYIRDLAILMFVLGLGATIEIVEYIVLLTIPETGVGGYHNNMQDFLANFAGCVLYITSYKIKKRVSEKQTYLPPAASKSARH